MCSYDYSQIAEHLMHSPCWGMAVEDNYGGENKSVNAINNSVVDN